MEIIDSKIQANLLQEFTVKYLEEHKELVEHIRETTKKQLILSGVSQQRELLEGFVDWFNINDKTQAILSERIEEYLKTL
jgi:hypothetical protein